MADIRSCNIASWLTIWLVSCMLGQVVAESSTQEQVSHRVLVIGIDGTRPDALQKAKTPNLDSLIREGAFTDHAQILGDRYRSNNTISGPGWSSILTGVWADKHGVNDNTFRGRRYEQFPHFFKYAKRKLPTAHTVSLVSWEPISEFIVSEADVNHFRPMQRSSGQILDVTVDAAKLDIDTRDGKWHHLLAVRSEGMIRFYLDGRLIAGPLSFEDEYELEGESFYLGRDTRTGSTCMVGQLDDARIWKRALTGSEIASIAKSQEYRVSPDDRTNLLAEYTFESVTDSGETLSVSETAGHSQGPFHLTTTGSPTPRSLSIKQDDSQGTSGNHLLDLPKLSGESHGLQTKLNSALRTFPKGDFSLEVRFRTKDQGRHILLGNYASAVGAINLELHSGNRVRLYLQPANLKPSSGLANEISRDQDMAAHAATILRDENPTAMFVYFHQVDATGHSIGFSPDVPEYVRAIENVDSNVGTILKSLKGRPSYSKEDWLIIVCTDHGGLHKNHGDGHEIPEIHNVFLILHGPSVKRHTIEGPAYLVDVAATALAHLTGSVDPRWQLDGKDLRDRDAVKTD